MDEASGVDNCEVKRYFGVLMVKVDHLHSDYSVFNLESVQPNVFI